jgi:hypothetical protein
MKVTRRMRSPTCVTPTFWAAMREATPTAAVGVARMNLGFGGYRKSTLPSRCSRVSVALKLTENAPVPAAPTYLRDPPVML